MKHLDLKNIDDLERLRNELNKVIGEHISKREKEALIENIGTLGFSKIKEIFECVAPKLIETKKGAKLTRKYVKLMKESKDLKAACNIHKMLREAHSFSDSNMLLSEAISLVKREVDFKNIDANLNKMASIVSECVVVSEMSKNELEEIINTKNTISESIDYLLFNEKTLKNIDNYLENFTNVSTFISENKNNEEPVIEGTPKDVVEEITENVNGADNIWEKKLLEDITLMYLSNGSEHDLFEAYVNKCVDTINSILSESSDVLTTSKMTQMKENLMNKKYMAESFATDMQNLAELNYTLNEVNN